MEWWIWLIIAVGGLVVLLGITFLIIWILAIQDKKKKNENVKDYYVKIVDIMGGITNIDDVSVNSSRLSVVLKDSSLLNNELLEQLKNEGVGVVKTSKKITLVIGDMAKDYYNAIAKQLEK